MPNRNPNTKSMIESPKAESQFKKQLVLSVLKTIRNTERSNKKSYF